MMALQQVWPQDFAERYRKAGYWQGVTMFGVLRDRAARSPANIAVTDGVQSWTFKELVRQAETIAAGFLALGLKPGDRVLVQLPNVLEFLSVTFGLFRAKLIPVFALPAHREVEIAHFARAAEASAFVIADRNNGFDYVNLAKTIQAQVPSLKHVVVVGKEGPFQSLASLSGVKAELPDDPSSSNVAFLQISGGSTGLSKLIPRTHDDYIYSFRASADICKLDARDGYLAALPVAHNFPMSSPGIFGTLSAGGRVIMCSSPSPIVAFPLIAKEKATLTGLVPPLALLWVQAAQSTSHDLSSLRLLQVGGAKLLPEIAKRISPTFHCTLQQVFGMAEGLVNYTRLDDPEDRILETQGRPISPADEVLVVDDDGAPVVSGEPGHLLTRGPYTIRAYHNDAQANAGAFTQDGYYRTGDIVRLTPDGYLIVQGRAGDHINRAGEKISAEEIEDHLLTHPDVFDAAVVSLPDAVLGEKSCAYVIAKGETLKPAALKAWMRTRGVAEFKVPDQVVFVDEFPSTAVGKISRKDLRISLRRQFVEAETETKTEVRA